MGSPSYMRSVVDRNVVMRRIPVLIFFYDYSKNLHGLCPVGELEICTIPGLT